ncbi:MAG: cyclic nucleotide-binding domain-containing protein [Deltaproteobacteria bacterium]|nr:MAG: cyclic nucleotide-binding domain-containing protein [Deltaproteobacteria bacterium]
MSSDAVSRAKVLQTSAAFRSFSESGLLLLAKIARDRSIPQGTPIFVQNMVSEGMFVVKVGVVALSIKDETGQERRLDQLTSSESFGELSLLIGGQRMVTATAVTDCELIEIPRREFANLQKQKPQACLKLMINIVRQFGKRLAETRQGLLPLVASQLDKASQ